MSEPLLLGIDEGTTAVKAALFDRELRTLREARRRKRSIHPRPVWVEQDAEEVLLAMAEAVGEVLEGAPGEVVACGLDHQGESVLAWEAGTGRPLSPIVLWQDKRSREVLDRLADPAAVQERSGMPLDPYFSAGKLAWLLEHFDDVAPARDAGTLRMGTVDSFIFDRSAPAGTPTSRPPRAPSCSPSAATAGTASSPTTSACRPTSCPSCVTVPVSAARCGTSCGRSSCR